jgi:hypothetical protein
MEHSNVEIFIDNKKHQSPNPTTGSALYLLGSIDPNAYDLYQEVHGKGDDTLIPNDNGVVTVKNGEHLFSVQRKLNPGGLCR